MATRVIPTLIDADNSYGSFMPAARNDWRFGDADSMSARAIQSPHQMPDIRLQAYPSLPQLPISPLLPGGSPYMELGVCIPSLGKCVQNRSAVFGVLLLQAHNAAGEIHVHEQFGVLLR